MCEYFGNYLKALISIVVWIGLSTTAYSAERAVTISEQGNVSVHSYSSPVITTAVARDKARTIKYHNLSNLLWIIGASIGFNIDHDNDGHYSNFTLSLDIDTSVSIPAIYAVFYLSLESGPWTEYAVTNNFTVHGSGPYDTYTVTADLDYGYPSGYYDQLIEVYDAHTNDLLITYGPNDSHLLQNLPIESRHHDNLFSLNTDITFSFSGAGSFGTQLLLPLICVVAIRRLRQGLASKNAMDGK